MKLSYLKRPVGILSILSIILLICAFSVAIFAYINSEYNKSKDPDRYDNNVNNAFDKSNRSFKSGSTSQDDTFTVTEQPETKDKLPILWMERFHISVTFILFVIEVVFLVLHLIKDAWFDKGFVKGIDFGIHLSGAILLLVSGIFMMYTATKIDQESEEVCALLDPCQLLYEKYVAAGLAVLTAVIFLGMCIKTFGRKIYQTV